MCILFFGGVGKREESMRYIQISHTQTSLPAWRWDLIQTLNAKILSSNFLLFWTLLKALVRNISLFLRRNLLNTIPSHFYWSKTCFLWFSPLYPLLLPSLWSKKSKIKRVTKYKIYSSRSSPVRKLELHMTDPSNVALCHWGRFDGCSLRGKMWWNA